MSNIPVASAAPPPAGGSVAVAPAPATAIPVAPAAPIPVAPPAGATPAGAIPVARPAGVHLSPSEIEDRIVALEAKLAALSGAPVEGAMALDAAEPSPEFVAQVAEIVADKLGAKFGPIVDDLRARVEASVAEMKDAMSEITVSFSGLMSPAPAEGAAAPAEPAPEPAAEAPAAAAEPAAAPETPAPAPAPAEAAKPAAKRAR